MLANLAEVMSPPEEAASFVARDRIVAFVADDASEAALPKGLEGANLEVKRGTIRNAMRMLETDTELFALVADISEIDDPIAALEDLARVCPADVRVALIGDNADIDFYRTSLCELGVQRVPSISRSRATRCRSNCGQSCSVTPSLIRPIVAVMSYRSAARRAAPVPPVSRSTSHCILAQDDQGKGRPSRSPPPGRRNGRDARCSAWAGIAHRIGKPDARRHAVHRTRGHRSQRAGEADFRR